MPVEEIGGEPESGLESAFGLRAVPPGEEARQRQKLVPVGFAGRAADGASRFRRDVDQIVRLSGRGAGREIETEAKSAQDLRLEPDDQRRGDREIAQMAMIRSRASWRPRWGSLSGSSRTRAER